MAMNGVQYIGPKEKVTTTGGKAGGGKWGQVIGGAIGGAAGALAAAPTGAGMVAGGIAGTAGGAALGGMIGNMISPAKEGTTAIDRRIQAAGPQIQHSEQSERLKASLMSLQTQPPEIQQEYMAPLVKAYVASVAQDNPKGGGMA